MPPENYDPIANEAYLLSPVSYGGSKPETRLQMLGNPMLFPNATPDNSTTDLLHCFTSNPEDNSLTNETKPDSICGTEGSYDIANDPPAAIGNLNVARVYCHALAPNDSGCPTSLQMTDQINDDIGHFRQYLLDTHVMGNFTQFQQLVDSQGSPQ